MPESTTQQVFLFRPPNSDISKSGQDLTILPALERLNQIFQKLYCRNLGLACQEI